MRAVEAEHATQGQQRFEFDDAFSDGEDNDIGFEFSSAAVRDAFARQQAERGSSSYEEERAEDSHTNGEDRPEDMSVSTLDIGRRALDSLSISTSPSLQSRSPDESQMSSDFSQVSLSDTPPTPEYPDDESHPYPHVIIDASESSSKPSGDSANHPIIIVPEEESVSTPQNSLDVTPPASLEIAQLASASVQELTVPNLPPSPQKPSSAPPSPMPSPQQPAPPSKGHRPTRSVGPSMMEKVVSKTRPPFLPPKSRQEDNKHMADWEHMMRLSRVAEEKRRKALAERRLARERKVEDSLERWQREIVPDWRVVHKNPALRKLWWGGIPTKLRATMWERAVGNALALSKDTYRMCLARAKRALSSGTFPTTTLGLIEEDILSTLPALHIFHPETGPLYGDLRDMLCAWVVSRSDEGLGYVKGIAKIAAMFLINMPAQQGFVVMRNLLERHCMRSFYGGMGAKDDVEAYYRIFDTLLADGMPKIYFNFKQHQISPASYLPEWVLPLFLDHLPFEACARVWDVLLLEGDSFLYRASLAILAVLEPRLFFPDKQELLELLRGENKAAIEVAKREARPMNGGKYEIYGVDEETLWERLDSMEDWWKESTWRRLIQRELPDI
ncbi:hypothetical protein PLICRDRAFT_49251 [Plicaturopsis crispa FD-325 SS-3]|nr:hypothetical protein PLICRDRAFT_49251 [Plicaturopsis crispa FD-325 SS-3]